MSTSPTSRPIPGPRADLHCRAIFGDIWLRLASAKARHDPANLFRSNQDIPPSISREAS